MVFWSASAKRTGGTPRGREILLISGPLGRGVVVPDDAGAGNWSNCAARFATGSSSIRKVRPCIFCQLL